MRRVKTQLIRHWRRTILAVVGLSLAALMAGWPHRVGARPLGERSATPPAAHAAGSGDPNGTPGLRVDPSGTADSAAAINAAAIAVANGVRPDVHLASGTYRLAHPLNIGGGQCLYGDGRGNTTLTVGADFDPAAKGVIVLTGREQQGPCVRDLTIRFAQPGDQTSRANFKTLAQHCTTDAGGSGCKYPPAIYIATANRFRLSNLLIGGAWDGIANAPGNNLGGFWLDTIEVGALNVGLAVDRGEDFCHIRGLHFWPFGLSAGKIFNDVYRDGDRKSVV